MSHPNPVDPESWERSVRWHLGSVFPKLCLGDTMADHKKNTLDFVLLLVQESSVFGFDASYK